MITLGLPFSARNSISLVNNAAARSTDGDGIIIYLSSPTTVSIHLGKITSSNTVRATWVNPETGEQKAIGKFPNHGEHPFTTPQGQKDAILLLDAVSGDLQN